MKAGLYILRNLLFLAHAGVIQLCNCSYAFPRLCGGDPYFGMRDNVEVTFSPPARG